MRLPREPRERGMALARESGDARLLRGCRRQVARLEAQHVLTTAGRAVDHVLYPGHRQVAVRAPVFIAAPPRSGTTLLFNLMANDPAFTCMKTWQSQLPAVSVYRAIGLLGLLDRPMGGRLRRVVDRLDAQTAGFEHIHRTRLNEPEEDSGLFLAALTEPNVNMVFPFGRALADRWYLDDLPEPERRRIVEWYLGSLRRHLYTQPGKRLLVKNAHLAGRLQSLRAAMPDLRVVNIVRHPYDTVPSSVSLIASGYRTMTGCRPDTAAPEWSALADATMEYYRRLHRFEQDFPAGQWVTVRFDDLVRCPLETVERIYDGLGLELGAEARAAIERDAGESGRHRSQGHAYTPEQFGLTRGQIHDGLREIFDAYGFEP